MNRLQKKCLVVSGIMHALLVVVLIVGPAFMPARPPINYMQVLDVIPAKLVDDAVSGGAPSGPAPMTPQPAAAPTPAQPAPKPAPKPAPPAPPAPKPDVKPEPPAVKPEPKPVRPEPQAPERVEPPKTVRNKPADPDEIPIEPPKTTTKPKIIVDRSKAVTRRVGGTSAEDSRLKAQQEAAAQRAYRDKMAQNVRSIAGNIGQGLSGGVKFEGIIGGGGTGGIGGGAAAANYDQAVYSIFDRAWYDPPEGVKDNTLNVAVYVVIARSGKVLSARLVKPSGNAALDRSVRRALERVDAVPPFPEGATDAQRSYKFNFDLESRRSAG